MTALSADRQDLAQREGSIRGHDVAANTSIHKGAMVCKDAGYAVPASDSAGLTHCIGVATERRVNAAGAGGAQRCRVQSGVSVRMSASGATKAWEGQTLFVVDDQTVALTNPGNGIKAGRCEEVLSATEVVVFFPLGGIGD